MAKTAKQQLTGDALVNKVAVWIIEIISLALIFGYVSDYATGTSGIVYFLIFEGVAIPSAIIVLVTYLKRPEKMRYVAFICFAIVYSVCVFGAHIDVAFVMAFPTVVVFILYYDYKLINWMTWTFNIICAGDVLYAIIRGKTHGGVPIKEGSSILLMEFLGTTIFLLAVRRVTKISIQNNNDKLAKIQAVADKVNESIRAINLELGELDKSSAAAKQAIEEIDLGVSNAVDAVQGQLVQTEAIQNRIDNVGESAGRISRNVETTLSAVKDGDAELNKLIESADESVKIGDLVTKDLEALQERIASMGAISRMIESIAFQTNIMALNANVEAARAGEHGKGFAVIASEISNMSAKTKKATDDIGEMVENASESLNALVKSIEEMTTVINSEKDQTAQTSEVFNTIRNSTEEVREHIDLFVGYINELTNANREIVQSVHTISATTEEINALTNEALDMEQGNAAAVGSIAEKVKELAEG